MKILIIGGGQDGIILSYLISQKYKLEGLLILRKSAKKTNYYLPIKEIGSFIIKENYLKLEKIIEEYQPTHIINTAALSSTIQCNKFKNFAIDINANFVSKLSNFIQNKEIKFIHLGSSLEKEYRPNCVYTISKTMASNFIKKTKNPNAIILKLPNHESPLRDNRFFIKEIIDLFQRNLNNNPFIIEINDGQTKRDWGWAPFILNKIMKMTLEDKFTDDFTELTCSLSLIEFTAAVAKIFKLNKFTIMCKKSGIYKIEDILLPRIPENTFTWMEKLILVKNKEIYNLEKWCLD